MKKPGSDMHCEDYSKQRYELPSAGGLAPPTLDLDRFLPYRLSILANTISQTITRLYQEPHGLTVAEWRLLAILAKFGPMSANGVCERTAMDKVRVSRAVARAVGSGLIDRAIDADDRRRSILTLTPHGRAVHDQIVPEALRRETEVLAILSEDEVRSLFDMLDRLYARALGLARRDQTAR